MSLFKQLFRGSHGSNGGGHHGKKHGASYSSSGYTEPAAAMQTCFKCNTAQAWQAQFCNQCGTSLAASSCNKCNTILAVGAKFCNQCGQPR